MKNSKAILFSALMITVLLLVTTLSSCKKCFNCTKQLPGGESCATCAKAGSSDINICDSDLSGSGMTLDSYMQAIESTGYSCTKIPGTPGETLKEKLCWQTDNAHNTAVTARATLESRGYACND